MCPLSISSVPLMTVVVDQDYSYYQCFILNKIFIDYLFNFGYSKFMRMVRIWIIILIYILTDNCSGSVRYYLENKLNFNIK